MAGKFSNGKLKIETLVREVQLFHVLPDGSAYGLFADKENVFYLENFNTQLRFEKNDQSPFDQLIVHEHGKDIELKRMATQH